MNVYKKIHYNQEIISSLKADEYPELARLRKKTTVIAHLYALMAHMLTYSSPVWPDRGRQYFLFSERHLAAWNRMNGGSGDITTWQSHKIFLLHASLIKTHVVIGEQTDAVLQRIWETAEANGRNSETLWSVPLYTPQVLKKAEQTALEYRENHVNLTHIRKNVIARVWGQRTADSLYRSSKHVISSEERYVEACLREAMKTAIKEKGFTTLEEILSRGLVLCADPHSAQHNYREIVRKIMVQKRLLIDSSGCEYHPIRKKDRVYAIPEDHKGFIITEK